MPEGQSTIIVNDKTCISCGICVSLCPHEALSMQERLPVVTGKCRVCGLCAASCVTKAISMRAKKFSDEGIIEEIEGDTMVFACRRKIEKDKDYGVKVISLLCSARFDPVLAAEAYAKGVKGIAVVGCEECRNRYGSGEAENKVWLLNEALEMMGEEARIAYANSIEDAVEKMKAAEVKKPEILKMAMLDRNLRAVIAKMRQNVEEGNVYGEKVDREQYEDVVRKMLRFAVNIAMVRHYAAGGAKVSEIAEKSGLSHEDVLEAVLEMKRRDEVDIEVEHELAVTPR